MKKLIVIFVCLFFACTSPSPDKRGADGIPPTDPQGNEWEKREKLHEPLPEPPAVPDSEMSFEGE